MMDFNDFFFFVVDWLKGISIYRIINEIVFSFIHFIFFDSRQLIELRIISTFHQRLIIITCRCVRALVLMSFFWCFAISFLDITSLPAWGHRLAAFLSENRFTPEWISVLWLKFCLIDSITQALIVHFFDKQNNLSKQISTNNWETFEEIKEKQIVKHWKRETWNDTMLCVFICMSITHFKERTSYPWQSGLPWNA